MVNSSSSKAKAYLSKSKFKDGLQCPKLLWYKYNRKEEIPPFDQKTQAIFDVGHSVEEYAYQFFPGGIKLERDPNPEKHHQKSADALTLRKPLFEAGFIAGRTYALADVLAPLSGGLWELYEIKSTSKVKEEHLHDLAFQKYTYRNAGINVLRSYLIHINMEYIRRGDINAREFLAVEEVTREIEPLVEGIEKRVAVLLDMIALPETPDIKIGAQCDAPVVCPLKPLCWKFLPPDNVTMIYYGPKLGFELLDRGILKIVDIPDDVKLNDKQLIQAKVLKSRIPHVDKGKIGKFLGKLKYPLYFLDFETINPAIPVFDNTRPFQQIPFQYSLHVVRKAGARPEHYSFLAQGDCDPRPELMQKLQGLLGDAGSIVAYNDQFERGVLRSAVEDYPEYANWFEAIDERFVDLLEPFKSFFYYHPKQGKSASLKSVLPAITDMSYEGLEIGEGGLASLEYSRVTFNREVSEAERQRVRLALEKYCALDTEAMIEILNALGRESK